MFGDTPLMRAQVLQSLASCAEDIAVLGFEPQDAAAYGRIILDDNGAPQAIVEYKDADAATRAIGLCNGGAMGLSQNALADLLPKLSNDNAQGEYYLPDLVSLGVQSGRSSALIMADTQDTLGLMGALDRQKQKN